jgi:hypothetical protein
MLFVDTCPGKLVSRAVAIEGTLAELSRRGTRNLVVVRHYRGFEKIGIGRLEQKPGAITTRPKGHAHPIAKAALIIDMLGTGLDERELILDSSTHYAVAFMYASIIYAYSICVLLTEPW